jgi:DNA-binding HxlR family transcriptional regulator
MTTKTPLPGSKVRGSRSGHPTMALLDLLGRRWALRILWELNERPATFRDLQERSGGVSPSVLNQRMRELRDARIVDTSDAGYVLTKEGSELMTLMTPLSRWAKRWAH